MRDQRDSVEERGRRDPGVGRADRTTSSPRRGSHPRPEQAELPIRVVDDIAGEEGSQSLPPASAPHMNFGPVVEFRKRHEREYDQPTRQMRTIRRGAAVMFE